MGMNERQTTYTRPSLTADVVPLRFLKGCLEILLIKRKSAPFAECYALPGGFVDANEAPAQAAKRELVEETGLMTTDLIELGVHGSPHRDPRGWVVSASFIGLVDPKEVATAGDDASHVQWFPWAELPALAFDHHEIIERAAIRRGRHGAGADCGGERRSRHVRLTRRSWN